MNLQVFGVDSAAYRAHQLHHDERIWLETNCYVDLWIELLHSMQLDPVACMAFTVAMDFEGDQWTFFKQPHADLYRLYGLDVQELAIWLPVETHVVEQVSGGKIPLVEVDSFYLPDTAGVAYGIEHTKTTVAIQAIDTEHQNLGYFHNSGYFELCGSDYAGLFGASAATLAPYTEIVKRGRMVNRSDDELTEIAWDLARGYLGRIPDINPFTRYRARFAVDLEWLAREDMAVFYKYAFATLRQCGACAEMASTFVAWLANRRGEQAPAVADLISIATDAKTVQFKLARMMATKKAADVAPLLDRMETAWDRAISELVTRYAA